ncbi:hypothetical protein EVAR_52682_1 [Eumeta japonica]|uniref:Uncharacterized protein n=1 Tax=Eumeta variegata TaxID=151549 RepID=A0A4C1Y1M2_EUMVA|nr:hypothetical protein EVAR_52682_1 [Eumeta japonica]
MGMEDFQGTTTPLSESASVGKAVSKFHESTVGFSTPSVQTEVSNFSTVSIIQRRRIAVAESDPEGFLTLDPQRRPSEGWEPHIRRLESTLCYYERIETT